LATEKLAAAIILAAPNLHSLHDQISNERVSLVACGCLSLVTYNSPLTETIFIPMLAKFRINSEGRRKDANVHIRRKV
jgi:hypothetical protein